MAASATKLADQNDAIRGYAIEYYEITGVDPASAAAGAIVDVAVTISGLTTSDKVVSAVITTKGTVTPLLILGAAVISANTLTLSFGNTSAGTLDGDSVTVTVAILRA